MLYMHALISNLFPYTTLFRSEAVEVLRWLCLGMALRVISWPMGYIIIAKGARDLFLGAETAWTAVYVGFADRKSTRLNSSHLGISYAVLCFKKNTYCDK